MGVFDTFRAIRHAKQMAEKLWETKMVGETDFLCLWLSGPELCHREENMCILIAVCLFQNQGLTEEWRDPSTQSTLWLSLKLSWLKALQ